MDGVRHGGITAATNGDGNYNCNDSYIHTHTITTTSSGVLGSTAVSERADMSVHECADDVQPTPLAPA